MFHEWSLIHLFSFRFSAVTFYPVFVKSVLSCNVVFLGEVMDHYIRSTCLVCLFSSYGQFRVVGSDQLNSLSCDSISWPNRPLQHSKSPKCVLFLKKTWMKCTVNRGELPLTGCCFFIYRCKWITFLRRIFITQTGFIQRECCSWSYEREALCWVVQ